MLVGVRTRNVLITAALATVGLATLPVLFVGASAARWSVPAALLPGLAILPFFTRLGREELLDGGLRPRIVDLLRAAPGLGITDVCQRLAIGWGTAVHHLTRLEDAGLVVSHDAGRHRRFFLAGEPLARRTAVCVLSTEFNRRLIEHIHANPGVTQTALCGALGVGAPLAHKYLARLIAQGLVRAERRWRSVQYYAGDAVAAALHEYGQLPGTQRDEGPSRPA